jgi:hypothetical protein
MRGTLEQARLRALGRCWWCRRKLFTYPSAQSLPIGKALRCRCSKHQRRVTEDLLRKYMGREPWPYGSPSDRYTEALVDAYHETTDNLQPARFIKKPNDGGTNDTGPE